MRSKLAGYIIIILLVCISVYVAFSPRGDDGACQYALSDCQNVQNNTRNHLDICSYDLKHYQCEECTLPLHFKSYCSNPENEVSFVLHKLNGTIDLECFDDSVGVERVLFEITEREDI